MGLTILFIYLKIILLFLVFSFGKISSIQTRPKLLVFACFHVARKLKYRSPTTSWGTVVSDLISAASSSDYRYMLNPLFVSRIKKFLNFSITEILNYWYSLSFSSLLERDYEVWLREKAVV